MKSSFKLFALFSVGGRAIVVVTVVESPEGVGRNSLRGASELGESLQSSEEQTEEVPEQSSPPSDPEPFGPPCTPAASNLAFASLGTSHPRVVPGSLTSGRAKHEVPVAQGIRVQLKDVHWANCKLIQAIWPAVDRRK